jgi:UDP-N-acetylglucosamine acyltransferase
MGGYSGIHQFTKVGAHAFLGNNAAVTRDVPPYIMAVGSPAVPHSINSEGLKRRGFSEAQIRNLKNAYRVLYRSDLKLADAVAELQARAKTQPELQPLVDFIGESTRSIVR